MSNLLTKSLDERQHKIQVAKDFLARTQELFDEFGSPELKTSHARFAELLGALEADAVRLVVLGEFSRGKSSLVNALLGIELLPTALQATTAINTFIRKLPEGRRDRFIRIHFQDGRPAQEVAWTDDLALERWGTELDESHADVRMTLDYIEAFMEHPLLEKGLVLIDTPGLETVIKHHEAITRKAIAEAHIALWVQNTTQLGGAATEWAFLTETLRTSFRKFVTVIGWWDKVLAPDDAREQRTPLEQRVQSKLDVVRQNFRKHVADNEEFDRLTSSDNLIPFSAHWAMGQDLQKHAQSGIDPLSRRIASMFNNGEALEEIYRKPLQHLAHIQQQLAETVQDELRQLASDKTLEQRARDLLTFDQDIKLLEQEADAVARDSREEHDRVARVFVEKINRELTHPLIQLKTNIETEVDNTYVKTLIHQRTRCIGLPNDLHEQFQDMTQKVGKLWQVQKQELLKALAGLSADYSRQMEKHGAHILGEMGKIDVQLPALDTSITLDFDEVEKHHRQAMALEEKIQAHRDQIDSIEDDLSQHAASPERLEKLKQDLHREERRLDNHGPQPSTRTQYRQEKIKDGGMYSSDTYGEVPYTDDSDLKVWREERDRLSASLANKEKRLDEIIAEEQRKTGLRMSQEKAQKKYEREVASFERKKNEAEQQKNITEEQLIHRTTQRLIKNTAGQLNQRIEHLQQHVTHAIEKAFADQLQALQDCVKEQYLEPLNAKLEKRREIQALMQSDERAIDERTVRLEKAAADLDQLTTLTHNALNS